MPNLLVGMRILDVPILGMTQVSWCGNDADTVRLLLGCLCCIPHGRSAGGNDHIIVLGLTIGRNSGELPLGMHARGTPEPASGMVFGATVTGMSIGGSGTLVKGGTALTG